MPARSLADLLATLGASDLPERNRMDPRVGMAEFYREYLLRRWTEGCQVGRVLMGEIQTLGYVGQVYWYFRQETGVRVTQPQAARGWYVLSGYASQRTNDLSSGLYGQEQSTPQSRNMDVAAIYFSAPMAASFGGELAMGMLIVVPAIILFLAMTLLLPETRGRELAAADDAHRAGHAA